MVKEMTHLLHKLEDARRKHPSQQAMKVIEAQLPKGFRVQTPYARGALAESEMLGTELALNSLSVVSLVGGAFVVLNSFLMSLGERRKQLVNSCEVL